MTLALPPRFVVPTRYRLQYDTLAYSFGQCTDHCKVQRLCHLCSAKKPHDTIHRFVACKTYRQRPGSFHVGYCFVTLSLYRSFTLSLFHCIALLHCRSFTLSLFHSVALSLYRSFTLPLFHSTALPLYRSFTLSLFHSVALPLYRSFALPLFPSVALSLRKCLAPRRTAAESGERKSGKCGAKNGKSEEERAGKEREKSEERAEEDSGKAKRRSSR